MGLNRPTTIAKHKRPRPNKKSPIKTQNTHPPQSLNQQIDIPEGSMMVPQDAKEVVVVVDVRGGAKKLLALGGYAAALLGAVAALGLLRTQLLLGH